MMNKFFDAGKLADDLQALVSDAETLLKHTAGEAGEAASEARERAEDALKQVRKRMRQIQSEARGHAQAVDGYVRDNPWQSVAIAGGVALILGLIMGRRN